MVYESLIFWYRVGQLQQEGWRGGCGSFLENRLFQSRFPERGYELKSLLLSQTAQPWGSPAPFLQCHREGIHSGTVFGNMVGMGMKTLITRNCLSSLSRGNLSICSPNMKALQFSAIPSGDNKTISTAKEDPKKALRGKLNYQSCIPFSLPKKFQVYNFWLLPLQSHGQSEWKQLRPANSVRTGPGFAAGNNHWAPGSLHIALRSPITQQQAQKRNASHCKESQWFGGRGWGKISVSHKSGHHVYHFNWCKTFSLTCFINPGQLWSPCLCL